VYTLPHTAQSHYLVANAQVTILEVQLATLNAEVLAMDMETLKARQEELDTAALLTELQCIKNELAALLALMSISPEVNNRLYCLKNVKNCCCCNRRCSVFKLM
jgi:hypothetical protein